MSGAGAALFCLELELAPGPQTSRARAAQKKAAPQYWFKDIPVPVPGTVPYTSVVELLLFCFVVFRISFFSSPDPDQTFFSESESESAEKSGSYPEKFGSGSMKKHPKTGVKVEKM